MDADALYPKEFHAAAIFLLRDGKTHAAYRNRVDVGLERVKYYFTDFGVSSLFSDDEETHYAEGAVGQDETLPEMKFLGRYDAFKADVYLLGNVYKTHIFSVCSYLYFV